MVDAHFAHCDEQAFLISTGRQPSPHEVACYASHLCLWRLCAAADEPVVVLEDDAELLPHFPAALAATERLIARFEFVRLQTYGAARHVRTPPVAQEGAFTLVHCESFPFGAMAYALSPRVARVFIAGSAALTSPVDCFVKRFWEPCSACSRKAQTSSALGSTTLTARSRAGRATDFGTPR